jgi:hypothetical protein
MGFSMTWRYQPCRKVNDVPLVNKFCNHDGEGSSPSRSTIYPIDTPWVKRGESSLPWDRMFPRHVVHCIESLKRESQHKEVPAKLSGAPTGFRRGRGPFGHDHS